MGKTWEYGNRTGFPSDLAEPIDVTSHSVVAPTRFEPALQAPPTKSAAIGQALKSVGRPPWVGRVWSHKMNVPNVSLKIRYRSRGRALGQVENGARTQSEP